MAGRLTGAAMVVAVLLAALFGGLWLFAGSRNAAKPPAGPVSSPPKPPVSPPWTPAALQELVAAIEHADEEGLRASDYKIDALRQVARQQRHDGAADALADAAALSLARDFAGGRIRNRHRFNWYIDDAGPVPANLARTIVAARSQGRLRTWLDGLLPTSLDYRALREALAATGTDEAERRDRIRANMERWRWLPRAFGQGDQLYVNLPAYRLDVVEGGSTVATYKAVIGATDMPTPALSATVKQVVANPDWIVPASIVRRSHLRPGASSRYVFSTRPDGTLKVRQKPGPGNALGRVKIVFPNPLAIYFHDTPSRSLFGASARTFSHGCVRVQDIDALAASLVPSPAGFQHALAGTQTRWFSLAKVWQANIVYLTLVRGEDGKLVDLGDPYHGDEPLAAALDHRKSRTRAAAPPVVVPRPTKAQQHLASTRKADEPAPTEDEQVATDRSATVPGNSAAEQ